MKTNEFLPFLIPNRNKVHFTDEPYNNMDVFQFRIGTNTQEF
ncbi:MAG: hypothetical protein WBG90_11715 [Saonia sp.]